MHRGSYRSYEAYQYTDIRPTQKDSPKRIYSLQDRTGFFPTQLIAYTKNQPQTALYA
jgi:hypothetical protein